MSREEKIVIYNEQLNKAWDNFHNKDLAKSEEICNALIIDLPDESEAYYLLGHINLNREIFIKALEQFSIALEKDKEGNDGGYINYWIGEIYNKYSFRNKKNPLYNTNKAKLYYLKAKEYDNYPLDVINKLYYEYKNDYDIIKLYEEGVKKFPNEISFYIHLARLNEKVNNIEKGIEILKNAINKGLKSASLNYNIGEIYFKNRQFSISRNYFVDAMSINKEFPDSNYAINYAIGNSYYMEGDLINAEPYYRKSFDESKNRDACWFGFYGLIIVYNEQNKLHDIEKLINDVVIDKAIFSEEEMYGGGPFWLDSEIYESINLIHDRKKIVSILKSLKFSEKNDYFLGKFWLIRALLAKDLDKHSDRFKSLKNSLKYLSPYKNEFLFFELSSVYSDLIEYKSKKNQDFNPIIKALITDLETYSTTFKEQVTKILNSIVRTLFKSKLYKDIVKLYGFFNEKEITDADLWFEIGYSLSEQAEKVEAKLAYERQIKFKGASSASLNNLANLYKSEGNYEKAIELYKSALKLDPKDKIPKDNLERTLKVFEQNERKKNQKKALDNYFIPALKTLKLENEFVLDKLNKFIHNIKRDENFEDWEVPIQKYKFPSLMSTDKQKAESLKNQWLNKNYIKESENRDEHNVMVYFVNPYLESEIKKISNKKIPENWINGFNDVTIDKLEEIYYFDLTTRIQKVNKKFKPLLERDFNELTFNYIVQNEKATIVLSGSMVELSLTYHYEKKKIVLIPCIDSNGKTKNKKLYDCVLNDLISFAEKNHLFGSDFPPLSNLSRIYRNFIHPGRELKDKLDKPKCDLCFISTIEILKKIL